MREAVSELYREAPLWRATVFAAGFFTALAIAHAIFVKDSSSPDFVSLPPPIPTGPGSYVSPYPVTAVAAPQPPSAAAPTTTVAPAPVVEVKPARPAAKPVRPLVDTSDLVDDAPAGRKGHAEAPGTLDNLKPRPLVIVK